jgi:hypothetical protein
VMPTASAASATRMGTHTPGRAPTFRGRNSRKYSFWTMVCRRGRC